MLHLKSMTFHDFAGCVGTLVFLKLNKRVFEQTGFTVQSLKGLHTMSSVDYLLPTVEHQPSTAAAVRIKKIATIAC